MTRRSLLSRMAGHGVFMGCSLAGATAAAAQSQAGAVIVYLDPMTTAGVGGTVNLAPSGQETRVQVTLNPAEKPVDGDGDYRMQVVQGSCSKPGRTVEALGEVHADGKTTRQQGDVRLADVRNGDHIILVADKHHNAVVACGMIPAGKR
jgi:Rieske Fe-S protein